VFLVRIATSGNLQKSLKQSCSRKRQVKKTFTESELQDPQPEGAGFIEKNRTVIGKAMQLADYHLFFGARTSSLEIGRFMAVTRDDISASPTLSRGQITDILTTSRTKHSRTKERSHETDLCWILIAWILTGQMLQAQLDRKRLCRARSCTLGLAFPDYELITRQRHCG